MADHHGQQQRIEGFMKRRQRRPQSAATWLRVVVVLVALVALAGVASAENETKNRPGLFSQVNNWFSRLRGNRDHGNGNDDKKANNDDKKEETSTKQSVPMYAMPGMPPGYMPSPYGAPMMAAAGPGGGPPPMFGMALPTNQFVNHAAPGGHRPMPMAFSPMAMGPPHMSANPFAFGGAHMMPVHHSDPYDPMGSHHHPHHHHPHHHGEAFGSFSPYGGFGQAEGSSGDEAPGGYFTGAGGGGQSDSNNDEDYGYGKTKK